MEANALTPGQGEEKKNREALDSHVPHTVIPIDKARILIEIADWKVHNAAYIVLETINRYFIDLDIVLRDVEDEMARWMADIDEFIVYEELYPLLEIRHKVLSQNTADMAAASSANRPDEISYVELKRRLEDLEIKARNHYDCVLQVTSLNPLTLAKGVYDFKFDGASIPLINAIMYNHGLENPTFHFGIANLGGKADAVFFEVEENGRHVGFYDFSHRPPLRFL